MSALALNPAYSALLARIPPRVIRTEEQNEAYIDALYELEQRQDEWSAEEAELADLLTLLIEDFEDKHYSLPKSSPSQVIEFLMDQRGMDQAGLQQALGTQDVAAVISGQRELRTDEIRKLSEIFHVSPELFFQQATGDASSKHRLFMLTVLP